MDPIFSPREVERYARHLVLKELGGAGQQKLKASTVAIVGMGGVGAPAALYLAGAGVGRLILIDDDRVSRSNLQRQIIYGEPDLGRLKIETATERLRALNPDINAEGRAERLTADNARALLARADLVLDGTDDFAARYAVNDACLALGTPLVAGALGRWDGQAVLLRGRPCWRCWMPEAPPGAETCERAGVVGALAGVIGSMAALIAIRALAKVGDDPSGRMQLFDGLNWTSRTVRMAPDPACASCSASSLNRENQAATSRSVAPGS